jgi:hypothetical protein
MITFWNDLNSEANNLDAKKRLLIIGFISGVQVAFLLIFKLYFFENV